ncbi:MAG: proton-conducting transporter membrane subunit [bacterium]
MSSSGIVIALLILAPALLVGAAFLASSSRAVIRLCAWGTAAVAAVAAYALWMVFTTGPLFAAGTWLMLDALSAYHLGVMMLVFLLSGFYSVSYFRREIEENIFPRKMARRYGGLWFGSLTAMITVLVSNNLGVMWVGIEATTLLTAFLICIHVTPGSLEAMWKYLLMCSVGVAVAFTGTLLIAASTAAGSQLTHALLWTHLLQGAAGLNPFLIKAGFIFLVIGYGTKVGLAPMHSWLPDAHSQAPAPVSAIFSGFLLNTALYCILRCLPLVEAATGNTGWGREILVVFGLLSILVAAIFIVAQHDIKRLLAYHSVEHLGIIAVGVGIGGIGVWAALFHVFNHSVCKALSFFCAGTLGQVCGTHDMRRMTGILRSSPVWGGGLIGSLLALIGTAPFALFMSEFLILKAALDGKAYATAVLFLTGLAIVFVGALRHVIPVAWGPETSPRVYGRASATETALVCVPLVALLVLGLWLPAILIDVLNRAAGLLGGGL